MQIDHKHKPWAIGTLISAGVAVGAFWWDAGNHVNGARGSTPLGLTLGGVALAMMMFCAALGLKRRVPHWRLGKAQSWMRGHLWLGLLTALLVVLHGSLRVGGMMGIALWVLITIVTLSGIVGFILQLLLPSVLIHSVPGETIAQQLERELKTLGAMARYEVDKFTVIPYQTQPRWAAWAAEDTQAIEPFPRYRPGPDDPKPPVPGAEPIGLFYLEQLRPFLTGDPTSQLTNHARCSSLFESLRTMTPQTVHEGVRSLEEIANRREVLLKQQSLMRWMTGWLIVHVPLSWLLLLLSVVHALTALRFSW